MKFRVYGTPKTQGSKRAFKHPRTGRVVMVEQAGHPLKDWRGAVSAEAHDVVQREHGAPLAGPIRVTLTFRLDRPKSLPKSASIWHTKSNADIDKLTRAVLDALTQGGAFGDDGQVCELHVYKQYADLLDCWTGVEVEVLPIRADM